MVRHLTRSPAREEKSIASGLRGDDPKLTETYSNDHEQLCSVFVLICSDYIFVSGAFGGQKRTSDSMDLELQAVLSCRTQVLGTEPGTTGRPEGALSY